MQGLQKLDSYQMTEDVKHMIENGGEQSNVLNRELLVKCVKMNNPSSKNLFGFGAAEDVSSGWERGIEQLVINHSGVCKIAELENFTSVRKVQMIDNTLMKIEGFEKCTLIEELSLEKNKILSIEGLSHLKYLKKLDLGRNRIKNIEGLSTLENLA